MDTVATTRLGRVEGRLKEGVLLFAGIPYAAPPTDERRFLPPEPPAAWSGVRSAQHFGPAAPQVPRGGLTDRAPVRWSEDCLTLNVSTPALDRGRRPVLVWIHGGGFRTGQGGIPWYNGASFAKRGDIVTVSINYRLGALGFLNLAELGGEAFRSSGLSGILDQLAALEWVRDNIEAFGGNPERVTIAGESAGGMSVGILLGCPRAAGLFRGAIPQSGAAHHTLPGEATLAVAREFTHELEAESLEALRKAPVDRLLAAQTAVEDRLARGAHDIAGVAGMPFQPTVDGRVLPIPPSEALRAGASSNVRVLVGTNRDEATLFGQGDVGEDRLPRVFERLLPDAEGAIATYRASRPEAAPGDLVTALTTDHVFRIPAIRLAEAHAANGGSPYMYLFSWKSRAFGGRLKATHALEIPFAFNNLERSGVDVFLGPGPLPQALAETMHDAWISFVRDGDPGHAGLPEWPAYEARRRAVMEFDETTRLLEDPDGAERELWDGNR